MKFYSWMAVVVMAVQLAACTGSPLALRPTGAKGGKQPQKVVTDSSGTQPPATGIGPSVAPVAGGSGGAIISNNSGALRGVAVAPAGLVSNNGGAIVTNGGAQWRVLALSQVPVPNAKVRLLEADQTPVMVDNQVIETTTDAEGRYAFQAALPARNLLVEIALPEGKGTLQAIAPQGAPQADADLVSTLTTAYILDRYVKGQADPAATLNKLPADIERETRQKAGLAMEGGAAAVPAALTTETAVATVETLRQKDPTFDAQMEAVKRLLVAAGLSDWGNGKLGTEVSLGEVTDYLEAPGGGIYLGVASERRIWWLKPDGRLEAIAGSGSRQVDGAIEGKPALQAAFDSITDLALDAAGRLVILEFSGRISRLEGQTLHELLPAQIPAGTTVINMNDPAKVRGLVRTAGGEVLAVSGNALKTIAPDGALTVTHTFNTQNSAIVAKGDQFGWDADGRLYIGMNSRLQLTPVFTIRRYDPATQTATLLADSSQPGGLQGATVDRYGNLFTAVPAGTDALRLQVQRPDGTTSVLTEKLPKMSITKPPAALLTPGNVAYLSQEEPLPMVHRITGGQAAVVVGNPDAAGGTASELALSKPEGIALGADGGLLISDSDLGQVLGADAAQKTRVVATVATPGLLRTSPSGAVYVLSRSTILELKADSTQRTAHRLGYDVTLTDFVADAEGGLYVSTSRSWMVSGARRSESRVYHVSSDGETTEIQKVNSSRSAALALKPDGTLLMSADGKLSTWRRGGTVEVVATHTNFYGSYARLALDAAGRVYVAGEKNIYRYDLSTQTSTTIAGVGGTHFTGTGVDDGIKSPRCPVVAPDGTLYFCDPLNRQIKRIPASGL